MVNKLPNKTQHLSVVGKNPLVSKPRVTTREGLSGDQLAKAQSYISAAEVSGVFVGALVGEVAWDIKPLLLERGVLSLLRFTDPALVLNQEHFAGYAKVSQKLLSSISAEGVLAVGQADIQLWQRRLFYQRTLPEIAELTEAGLGLHPVVLAQKLALLVKEWRTDNIIHGHLSPGNIAVEDFGPVVLDFGFCAFSPELWGAADDVAPEVKAGALPTQATDIYGLGLLLERLLAEYISEGQRQMLAGMVQVLPSRRPSIDQVIAALFPGTVEVRPPLAAGAQVERENLKLGKVLGKDLRIGPVEEAPREQGRGDAVRESEPEQSPSRSPEDALKWLAGTVVLGRDLVQKIKDSLESEPEESAPVTGGEAAAAIKPPAEKPKVAAPEPPKKEAKAVKISTKTQENLKCYIEKNEKREAAPQSISLWFWAILIVPLVVIILHKQGVFDRLTSATTGDPIPYQAYWQSNLRSKMKEVALAAISGKEEQAEFMILREALEGKNHSGVNGQFLRVAFNPLWEAGLTQADRNVALKLALAELVPEEAKKLPSLEALHPGVLLAIIGGLKIDDQNGLVAQIQVQKLAKLPPPYGTTFANLADSNVKTFADRSARALAQIWYGNVSPEIVAAFLADDEDAVRTAGKIKTLLVLNGLYPNIVDLAYSAAMQGGGVLHDLVKWFDGTTLSHWKEVAPALKLSLAAGIIPNESLKLENYADLLQFPVISVRQAAEAKLNKDFFQPNMQPTISLLATPANRLSRYQTIFLVTALGLDKETRSAFIAKWFEMKPDPQTVVDLIIARRGAAQVDPFCIEGARYLRDKPITLTSLQMQRLMLHSEPLVRALAYSRLDVTKPADVQVLRNMLKFETLNELKEQIRLKLEDLLIEAPGAVSSAPGSAVSEPESAEPGN